MNWRNTFILFLAAAGLALFISVIERPARLARSRQSGKVPILTQFSPASVTTIEIQSPTNRVTLLKSNGLWEVATPALRPADSERIESLLQRIAHLSGQSVLTTDELNARPNVDSEFGLNPPAGILTLQAPGSRIQITFGARNVNGSQVFYQVSGIPGIFVADANFFAQLASEPGTWRDATFLPLDQLTFDRIRVVGEGGAFTLARGLTNGAWELVEPRPARADTERVNLLLRQLSFVQVNRFIASTAAPPAEIAGLRSPRLTLSLQEGSNDVFEVSFGRLLTHSTELLARRTGEEDLLAVPAHTYDLLPISYKQLLDSRILRFNPAAVREIVFDGRENFRLVLEEGGWRLLPAELLADPQLVARVLAHLARFEILDLAKEVVTPLDLPTYGLAPPSTRITLRASPGATNSTVAVLELGAFRDNQIFARVPDEGPVYALNPAHVMELPDQSWRLRDRGLWRFEPESVRALTVTAQGLEWTISHAATNEWAVPAGWRDEINPFALEEAVFQFGRTRALAWVGEGEDPARNFGTSTGPQLRIEFRGTPPRPPLHLGFGKASPAGNRYVSITLPDDGLLTFELSGSLCDNLWKEIGFIDNRAASAP